MGVSSAWASERGAETAGALAASEHACGAWLEGRESRADKGGRSAPRGAPSSPELALPPLHAACSSQRALRDAGA